MEKKEKKYNAILIFGPPGVGKGTQAKLIAEKNKKYFHFSTGEMFRALKTDPNMRDSELGKRVESLLATGNLLPDDLTVDLFFKTLEEYSKLKKFDPKKQTLILDGIPRNPNQVDLIKDKIQVIKIISLVINNSEVLVERLKKRAQIEGRIDDADESIIRKRLEVYKKETHAVTDKYSSDLIISIDGLPSIEEIHSDIISKLT